MKALTERRCPFVTSADDKTLAVPQIQRLVRVVHVLAVMQQHVPLFHKLHRAVELPAFRDAMHRVFLCHVIFEGCELVLGDLGVSFGNF